jgi:hypothetical protein
VLFGLGAPAFSWVISAGLIVYCLWIFLGQLRESKIRQRFLSVADRRLTSLHAGRSVAPGSRAGISGALLGEIEKVFSGLPPLRAAWQAIDSSIISRTGKDGEELFWVAEDVGAVFTGVGFLATFLAILVALLDVRFVNNRIQGLDLLIQGLSGKFLSSVVAVACATALVFFEKGFFHPVKERTIALGATLRNLLPRFDTFPDIARQS